MLEAPPLKKRPTWNADTMVEPAANVSGSTSVRCWLVALVYGSLLIRRMGTLAKAAMVDERENRSAKASAVPRRRRRLNGSAYCMIDSFFTHWLCDTRHRI